MKDMKNNVTEFTKNKTKHKLNLRNKEKYQNSR